jgi:hypothetical protein
MDHQDALELIEIAAAEPAGLERLMAGDTPDAARLAGHLAECAPCGEELRRIERTAAAIRAVVREQPAPDLRGRTLAFVRDVGRPRGTDVAVEGPSAPVGAAAASAAPAGGVTLEAERDRRARRRWLLPASLVASIAGSSLLAAGVALAVVGADRDASEQRYEQTISALAKVNVWTLRVDGAADSQRVALASSSGSGAAATLVFSPSTTELVVVATDLAAPPDGSEYRCWVEVAGKREGVGKMFFGGGLAYWVGEVPAVAQATDGTRFGISLMPLSGGGLDAEPVMAGEL